MPDWLLYLGHELARYWNWAGSNVGAMPACGLLAGVTAVLFRKPLGCWWRKHFGHEHELAEIRQMARDSLHIAAEHFEHHAGHRHHLDPRGPDDHLGGSDEH